MVPVDDPRSEPRFLHELTQSKMGEKAESDIAISFVDKNDYREISAKAVSAKRKLIKNRPSSLSLTVQQENPFHHEYSLRIIYNLQFEERNLIFLV